MEAKEGAYRKKHSRHATNVRRARVLTGRNPQSKRPFITGPSGDGPSGQCVQDREYLASLPKAEMRRYLTNNETSSFPSRMKRAKLPALSAALEVSPLVVTHRIEYRYPSGEKSLNTS